MIFLALLIVRDVIVALRLYTYGTASSFDKQKLPTFQIQYIGDGRVRSVRARSLRLSNNRIKEIAGYAFTGSTFLKLSINGNEELTDLSTDAFKGITELHHLDLSDTSISSLPIIGLKNLKTLTLKNVPTLKRLPPVLSFTHLETAHFTYAHHCCLFKYVDDVVEGENGLYKNNAKEIHHRICKQRATSRKRREVRHQYVSRPCLSADLTRRAPKVVVSSCDAIFTE
ncbi:unnamed protein product [Heligmosomoides polygyrus]|uniref:Leucine Rich repeat-containing domain protein n=1 Tax=Heligmosomoides polygyrus TaxID=6339 RepID=A0A183GHE3_HELPZ|nr:unnamed protein product [Heligmosomoides polygyrus]